MAKHKKQAQWLEREHADAAASLLEGLQETFTINVLGLPPSLTRCLSTPARGNMRRPRMTPAP